MTMTLDALESEVLNLPVAARAHLMNRLIASLDADPEIQAEWAAEAERRDAEITSGQGKLIPGEEAIARLRAQLR